MTRSVFSDGRFQQSSSVWRFFFAGIAPEAAVVFFLRVIMGNSCVVGLGFRLVLFLTLIFTALLHCEVVLRGGLCSSKKTPPKLAWKYQNNDST